MAEKNGEFALEESMKIENSTERTKDYQKLLEYGLDEKVAAKLGEIYKTGKLAHVDLDERALDTLKELPVDGALNVLGHFLDSNLEHVSNKSAYLCIMKTYRNGELALEESMKIENTTKRTKEYQKLLEYGLDEKVAAKLGEIYKTGKLAHVDLDERALDTLKELPVDGALNVLGHFLDSNFEHISNKSAYLCIMKMYQQKSRAGVADPGVDPAKGPDEEKIKAILERSGYTLDVTTGQRKYGGPPPGWDGSTPGSGCEVFCGNIPNDMYEDELIPLFEECGAIWDLRLMMDPTTGTNRGYAFVAFTARDAAQSAVQKLDNYEIKPDKMLKINISVPNLRLFVANIPKSKSKEEILDEFDKLTAGLMEVIIYSSPDDKKKNRGFCFLEYESHKAASLAKGRLEMGFIKVWGCDIIVDWAVSQEEPDEQTMSKVKVLYVRNLTQEISEGKFKETFEGYGKDAEKKEMKKLISSILISCPLSMTVNKLNRDYYEAIGERIPYAKFGYQSLDSCLRDMPDVLQVQGIGGNAFVKVFVSSKVAHIDKLISSQRLPDKKRPHFGRRPRQYNQNSNRRNNYTPRTYGQSDTYAFSPNRTPSSSEIYVQNERLTSPRDVPLTNFKFEDVNLSEISNDPKEVANLQQNIKESPKLDIKIDCDNACGVGQNGIQFNSRQSSPELFESDTDEDLVNYKVPFVVQQNLKTLISNYSDGLFCARIPEIYKKMFRKELCFNEYGYRSLIQMCESLKTIFFCHQPDKTDFKVYDVSKPIPVDYTKSLKLSEYNDYLTSFPDSRASEELELPEDFSNLSLNFNYKYPLDVLQLYENIPREFVPDSTKRGDDTEVCIGEVYDPSKFWVILRSSWSQLQELMDDMQIFYINRDQSLLIPKHIMQVGLYCVVKYASEYHRAIIVKTNIPRDKVKVFYVDYGTVSSVNANELCFLHRTFIHLPQQAIRARLASIYPVHEQVQWSLESSNRFLDLVRSKDLVAQMRDVNFEEQIIEIILADTSGEEDIFINDTLVNEGYALFTHQIQLKTTIDPTCIPCIEFIHLYPTFEELELAKVPSTVETIRLLNVGISLSNVYSHYFYKSDEIPQREAEKEVEIQSKPVSEASRSRARLAKVQEVIGDQNANSPPMYKSASEASSRKLKKDVNDVCSPETKVDKTKCIESPSPSLASVRTETESTNEDILMGCNTRVTVEKPPNIPLEPPKSLNPANTNDYKMATIVKPPPGFQKQTVPVPNFVNVPQQVNPILLQPYHIQNSMPQFPLLNPAQHNMLLASMIQNQQVQQQQHNNLSCFNNYLLYHIMSQINNPQIQIPLTAYNYMAKQIFEQLLKGNMNVYKYIDLLILQKGNAIQRTSFDILQQNYSIVSYDNARPLFESFFILLTNNQILELYNYIVSQLFKKESIPKLVVQRELNGKSICLIRYENNIYVLVDEILEHINVKIPIEIVKKLIVMENPNFCVLDINLNENRVMKEELCRFRNVASASVIHLFSFQDLPKIVKIFDPNCSIFNNFDIILSKICNINGDM